MTIALRRPMSREEFLDWDGHLEGRWEFDGVRPVATTGGNVGHSRIVVNLLGELARRLAGSPCQVLGPDAGIGTVGASVRYPDAVITCSPYDPGDKLLPDPVVVFEVVSPGSVRTDRVIKPVEYAAVPSILRSVIVEPWSVGASVLSRRRGQEPFAATQLVAGEVVPVPEAGIELPIDRLYEGVLR